MHESSKIVLFLSIIMKCSGFFINKFNFSNMPIVQPKTNIELTTALCSKKVGKVCIDEDPKLIIIESMFNFTGTEGNITQLGCWHLSSPECYLKGQQKLNFSNQCAGLEAVNVTYDTAGINPLYIGSNKYVTGLGQQTGLIGRGIFLHSVSNIVVQNISITDINPRVILAGDAIIMDNVTNILIDGNYIQGIGRQMIVTGFGPCQNVTISNNIFNGSTPFSAYCNGKHYWTWLFLGKDDRITMYKNKIFEVSGRFPHMGGMRNSSVLVHMIENTFHDTDFRGGMELDDTTVQLFAEGNNFTNVPRIFLINYGSVYFPLTQEQCNICTSYIGRPCEVNTLVNSTENTVTTDLRVLTEMIPYAPVLTIKSITDNIIKGVGNAILNPQNNNTEGCK